MAFRVKENGAEVARRLERVVLGRDAAVEVLVKEGNLAQDVVAHTGHFTEEEEGEGASSNTEGGSNGSVLGGHVDAHTPEVGRNVVPNFHQGPQSVKPCFHCSYLCDSQAVLLSDEDSSNRQFGHIYGG